MVSGRRHRRPDAEEVQATLHMLRGARCGGAGPRSQLLQHAAASGAAPPGAVPAPVPLVLGPARAACPSYPCKIQAVSEPAHRLGAPLPAQLRPAPSDRPQRRAQETIGACAAKDSIRGGSYTHQQQPQGRQQRQRSGAGASSGRRCALLQQRATRAALRRRPPRSRRARSALGGCWCRGCSTRTDPGRRRLHACAQRRVHTRCTASQALALPEQQAPSSSSNPTSAASTTCTAPGTMGDKLMEQIFNLKFTAKQLTRCGGAGCMGGLHAPTYSAVGSCRRTPAAPSGSCNGSSNSNS